MKFTGKIKLTAPHEQNHGPSLVKTGKAIFSKLTWKISLLVSGEQAREHLTLIVFLSQIYRYFPAFYVVILVEYPVLLLLGKCLMDS